MAPWPYNIPAYQQARKVTLRGNPPCQVTPGCPKAATTADHHPWTVLHVRRGLAPVEVLWDPANLRPACRSCNSRLGARAGNRWRRRSRLAGEGRTRAW